MNGSADFENIFARISDSKRDFNGFPDPVISADCDSAIFWAGILDFAGNKSVLPGFRMQAKF